jgi:hypothetical protein
MRQAERLASAPGSPRIATSKETQMPFVIVLPGCGSQAAVPTSGIGCYLFQARNARPMRPPTTKLR